MHRCRECEVVLQEGRNWHASYAARTYRHCMECARAYSRKRYGRIRPNVKRRSPAVAGSGKLVGAARERKVRDLATAARKRRAARDRPT